MCGRFTLRANPADLMRVFSLLALPGVAPRYNIAPTQQIGCIVRSGSTNTWVDAHWGFVPAWQRSSGAVRPLINARAESVHEKPSFRESFRRRRCLVPFDGFFEWQTTGTSSRKQPWLISVSGGALTAFAALYELMPQADGPPKMSCCLLTTAANALVSGIHDRMPVILTPEDRELWMTGEPDEVMRLLRPYPSEQMERVPVGFAVGNARNEMAECVVPAGDPVSGVAPVDAGNPQTTSSSTSQASHADP